MLDKILEIVNLIVVGALLGVIVSNVKLDNLRKENIELRLEKVKLENKINELDYKQAELTKRIAELNGIGG
ncbi:hypothetical protein [Gemella haemolysans]|uniref:hypothetical protein n=1 Tax=Gemella haemolysans TaxID=1379 RepID=UPI00195AF20C|nr:hypothetical protein [Gemella haemolysans]VTX71315.1 Uncharacterised protein [Gemella haemolysans]